MYYPIRVCTPHQVLRYTLQGKGWEYPKDYFGIAKVEFDHCSLQPLPTAQQVYRELKKEVNDTVLLLHSQFTRRDRNKIENDLGNKLPRILVATQVVEVSLDLDFQQAFTEPAPIDALAQRMGRVNRRARQQQPAKVHIFTEQAHKFNIYDPELTAGSLRALSILPMPLSEEELNYSADKVYGNGYNVDNQREYNDGLNYKQLKYFRKYLTAVQTRTGLTR